MTYRDERRSLPVMDQSFFMRMAKWTIIEKGERNDGKQKDVIKLLERIALYLELKGENPFKISAYRKAAQALERDDRSIADIDDFTKMKGIGKGTGAVIESYIQNGTSETLTELEKEVPEGLIPLLNLPGLGGKKLSKIYQELGVTDAESLRQACENGQVESLEGFGKKICGKNNHCAGRS